MHNVVYPVTIETLHQIFSKYGNLQKCVIFHNKNGSRNGTLSLINSGLFQTLLQFSSIPEASAAKQALDGQNIYTGCCSLKIQFSSMNSLTVKFNNDKTRFGWILHFDVVQEILQTPICLQIQMVCPLCSAFLCDQLQILVLNSYLPLLLNQQPLAWHGRLQCFLI